jgi:predicted 3-demethylubiquinone-9 3-methyltransferase (glyoxalase superfamily)
MIKPIYPCLWFDSNAKDAADYYISIFENAKILSHNPTVTSFEISGTKFMALNGGPTYQVNSAVSYFVYCEKEEEIDRLYTKLSAGGSVLMELGKYNWAEKYAWVIDKFGVNWQLDFHGINSAQKVVPCLLFVNEKKYKVKAAINKYTALFENSSILVESPYIPSPEIPDNAVLFAQMKLNGFIMNAMSSPLPQKYDFTPGNSFVIECDTQEEIDLMWGELGMGGKYNMCGWLDDKYGVSWQVVSSILPKLMSDPERGPRVIQAFLKMQKFDIAALENA